MEDGVGLDGLVASPDGKKILRSEGFGIDAEQVGRALGEQMISSGALDLLHRVPINAGGGDHL